MSAVAATSLLVNIGAYAVTATNANIMTPINFDQMLNAPLPKNLTPAQRKQLIRARAKYKSDMAKLTPEQRAQVEYLETDIQNKINEAMRQQQLNQTASQQVKSVGARGVGSPSVSIASPNAFGDGTAFFGSVGYVNHFTSAANSSDGFMGVGTSFGDAKKYIGYVVSINNDNLGWRSDAFAANGGFSLHLNHYFTKNTAVAAGAGNLGGWGVFRNNSKNYYFAATQGFTNLRFPISINAGFGTGTFYSAASSSADRDDQVGPFGGIGVGIYKNLSLIADYASRQYNVGGNYNFIFLKKLPMFLAWLVRM